MGIFFAGMIMFAFVLSLFPLAVIREKVRWIRYALVDGAVFALVCLGINGVCRLKFEQKSSGGATCLIDHLLLCGRMRTWQEITCLLAMVVFILVIGAFVFSYASRQYAGKNMDGIPASAGEEKCRNWQTSKTKDLVIIAIVWVQVPSSALRCEKALRN